MESHPSTLVHAKHLPGLYRLTAEKFESLPAFATRQKNLSWKPLTFRSLYERGRAIGEGLISIGVESQEPVGIFSDNRVEWALADAGIQLCGAVNTPKGIDLTDDELVHIVNHSGMRTAFVETSHMAKRCLKLRSQMPGLHMLIKLDGQETHPEGVLSLNNIESIGRKRLDEGSTDVDTRSNAVKSEDLFSLIYTSGTTGKPKGVMLSHANIISQVECAPLRITCTDRLLSILPIWHVFERMVELYSLSCGACTYYTSARHFGDDLKQVEPTFMGSAPRLWESLRHRILTAVEKAHPVRRILFHIALFLGVHYREAVFVLRNQDLRLHSVSPIKIIFNKVLAAIKWVTILPWFGFFNAAVLETVRRKAGGSLKGTVSGGGALSPEIDRFFNAIGIPMLEGYGLTETSPVIAARTPECLVRGTVGPPIPQTEIRIVDLDSGEILYPNPDQHGNGRGLRGEIQIKGPQVMLGYYKDDEATRKVLDDAGWFRTGDLGMITFNDSLKILGRSKATIVLSNGENVEPEHIEMRLKLSPLIAECIVVGQDAKHVCALILPDLEACREAGFVAESLEELVSQNGLRDHILEQIHNAMSNPLEFKRYEVIHDFRFLSKPLEVGVELTNLFKIKRHVIHDRYADLIREMVEPEAHHD
ncbi:MAG: long-chain fatty acid--CoA ligase [Opitutales bacterium]|nr:long-chain fatty acid--CoA ligase [Opitutales bacterium]